MGLHAHPRKGKLSLGSVDLVHSLNRETQESKSHNTNDGDPQKVPQILGNYHLRVGIEFRLRC